MIKKKLSPEMDLETKLRIAALTAPPKRYTSNEACGIYAVGIGTGAAFMFFLLRLVA